MHSEVTSVYVPVKTADYKLWAILLSILVHIGIIAGVWFFYHNAPPPPMETSLVSPDELSQIEGQIRANQKNNGEQAGQTANTSMTEMLSTVSKTTHSQNSAQPMNDTAAKQAQWRNEQEKIAQQLDKEAMQDPAVDEKNGIQPTEEVPANHQNESNDENRKVLEDNLGDGTPSESKTDNPPSGGNNELSKGGGSHGNDVANYTNVIFGIIKSNWQIPTNSKSKLNAAFDISPTGEITNIRITNGSEISQKSLKNAIERSQLPPPPSNVYSSFQHNNLEFNEK